jgi:demethylmenaquinone methyltransferase/2-methoxy-6-polyprenyl-1,4-benzoquinol methylase
MTDEKRLIKQQIEYYGARAAEYDEWILRQGRYDRGEDHRRRWLAELADVRARLEAAKPHGAILELACGTGQWTVHLARCADHMVAVDASQEMIEINRQQVRDDSVEYIKADLFDWQPTQRFDFVFFGFWLSHVPSSRFDTFWNTVADALKPGGRVFFVDSLFTKESTAVDHKVDHSGCSHRKLDDGREFDIVKEFYEPDVLMQTLSNLGWKGNVDSTGEFFLQGLVRRSHPCTSGPPD